MSSLPDAVNGLLATWGIAPAEATERVEDALADACRDKGVDPASVSVRWGRATIETDQAGAARLRWCTDHLDSVAARASSGTVTSVRVRAQR